MIKALSILAMVLGVYAQAVAQSPSPSSPVVRIESGRLQGQGLDGIHVFKGIPFAAAPQGDLRWRAPQPVKPWNGLRPASQFGAICPQPAGGALAKMPQSEDCLSINIWAPKRGLHAKPLPVMFWIHGGGSFVGSGSDPLYDGAALAREGVIVVTFNYRLGVLGYFVHPALSALHADGAMLANYGLMDQLAALRWVRRNIAAFGGDARNITIFGESAGGCAVNMWMTSPATRGLFARAISHSCPGYIESRTMQEGAERGVALAQSLGISGTGSQAIEQLRARPASDFLSRAALKGTYPFIDGILVPQDPFRALAAGKAARVPWMIGSNSFDASYLPFFGVDIAKPLAAYTPADRARILATYGGQGGNENRASLQFLSDMVMGASDRRFAGDAARVGASTWLYHFRYGAPADAPGVPHGGELPYVFGNPGQGLELNHPGDQAVSAQMRRVWADFAKGRLPLAQSWSHARRTLVFDERGKLSAPRDYHRARLDLAAPFARDNAGRWDP